MAKEEVGHDGASDPLGEGHAGSKQLLRSDDVDNVELAIEVVVEVGEPARGRGVVANLHEDDAEVVGVHQAVRRCLNDL